MPESNIRTEIKNILLGISGMGRVYDIQKSSFTEESVKTGFVFTDILSVWFIGDVSSKESMNVLGFGVPGGQSINHVYKINGYYGVKESANSRLSFSNLISAISIAFRGNITLNGSCFLHKYIEISVIDYEMFCNYLCHHTELVLQVEERI